MLKIICLILFFPFTGNLLKANAQPRKIIIDTDPGVEDAMQLIAAMQYPGMDILGITTTTGGANIVKSTKNALTVVELLGKNIPVFQGAAKPLFSRRKKVPILLMVMMDWETLISQNQGQKRNTSLLPNSLLI